MTTTDQRVQQVVLPEAVARKMFPADSKWLLPNEMPTITWLAGPIVCETCDGDGEISYPEWEGRRQPCRDCDTLGYPPTVEIVSEYYIHLAPGVLPKNPVTTVHGRLTLGTPVPVVSEVVDSECVAIGGNGYYHLPEYRGHPSDAYDITDAVAGTLTPGGVAYPLTVAE